jgi:hypothetical protein
LCSLLAAGAQRHGAKVVSSEVAQPAQVLLQLLALATITFILTTARARGGVRGTRVDVARSNHRSGLASALLLPRLSLVLVFVLVLVLVVTPRTVLAIRPLLVLVAVLVLDLLWAVGDEVSRLAALEA